MLTRNEKIFKWILYGLATVFLYFIQGALLQRIHIWNVIPFLYPMLPAVLGMYEGSISGSIYGMVLGIWCDQLLPAPIPCFYTLVFPLIGLFSALIAEGFLPAGFLCGLVVSALSFFLTDIFHCFLLWTSGQNAWQAGLDTMFREYLISLPLLILISALFAAIFRRTRFDD